MNVREIEIFRAVMQAGSITGAAKRLNIAQPAVSKYIAQLERRVGLALFVRMGNRIAPTPEAKALYEQVERLFVGLNQVERFMADMRQHSRGHVTMACLPLLSLSVLPDVVATFMRERPDVTVALQTRSSSRIVEWVAARQVDFGIGIHVADRPDVITQRLVDLELFCALPPGDPLEDREEIGIEDLAGRDLIALSNHDGTQIALDALLETAKVAPRRRIEVFWTSVALELALKGAGIAFVDAITASRTPHGAERLRRFSPRLSLDLRIFWPEHWRPSELALALSKEIEAGVRTAAGG
jgi:DNA-binding transcriptional LysR family regulator